MCKGWAQQGQSLCVANHWEAGPELHLSTGQRIGYVLDWPTAKN